MYENVKQVYLLDELKREWNNTNPLTQQEITRLQTVIDCFKKDKAVWFTEQIHFSHWQYFVNAVKDVQGTVILFGRLPEHWPTSKNLQIEICNAGTSSILKNLSTVQIPMQYHRNVKDLSKDFLCPYGSYGNDRECVMQTLERLDVFDNSIYSRPPTKAQWQNNINIDYLFPIRLESQGKTIDIQSKTISHQQRFDHAHNILQFEQVSKQVHCWVVLENWCLNDQLIGQFSEKIFYPILWGVPFVYVASREAVRQIEQLGIVPNDTCRFTERGVAEQLLWLKQIFRDKDLAQQWQDAQGETIINNRKAFDRLADKDYWVP